MSNYFLNVGPTGEGGIPAASLERLAAIGEWMKINGESIQGTTASMFPKVSWNGRSTTRRLPDGNTRLYLHVFARPADGKLTVKGLVNRPDSAAILGQAGKLEITGKEGAWTLEIPTAAINPTATVVALAFRTTPVIQATVNEPDAKGVLKLEPADAKLHGETIRVEGDHIGFWTDAQDFISWNAELPAGNYQVTIDGACESGGSEMKLTAGSTEIPFSIPATGSWQTFQPVNAGILKVAGEETVGLNIRAVSRKGVGFVNLRSMTLTKKD